MSAERLSPERHAEYRRVLAAKSPDSQTYGHRMASDLLAELDAVTRERDAARNLYHAVAADALEKRFPQ